MPAGYQLTISDYAGVETLVIQVDIVYGVGVGVPHMSHIIFGRRLGGKHVWRDADAKVATVFGARVC